MNTSSAKEHLRLILCMYLGKARTHPGESLVVNGKKVDSSLAPAANQAFLVRFAILTMRATTHSSKAWEVLPRIMVACRPLVSKYPYCAL
jgi:hypothetical protein